MIRLKNFLCFDLETGGKIVAWLGMVRYALYMAILIIIMFIGVIIPCRHIDDQLNVTGFNHEFLQQCHVAKASIIWTIMTILTFFSAMFYVYYALFEGIQNKCSRQIVPGIIYEFIALFLGLLYFVGCNSIYYFVGVAIMNVINAFLVWTLLSIHENIKEGATSSGPIYYIQK